MANKITNEISTVFTGDTKKLEASVKNAEKQMGRFKKQVDKTNGTSGGGSKGASNGGSGMQGMLATAGRLVPALSAAFAIREITRFGAEAVKLGSVLDGVESTFRQIELSGATSLQELRTVTRGAVDDLRLMSAAVQAKNFKVPLEDLASFFEFATIRAAQTGESVDYLTNSIVLGIGRKSPLILDNLGITLVRLKEAMGKVGRESATVAEISAGVSKIAKEETALLKDLGLAAETTAQKLSRLTANFKNFQTAKGQEIAESGMFQGIIDIISLDQEKSRLKRTKELLQKQLGMNSLESNLLFNSDEFKSGLQEGISFFEKQIAFAEFLLKKVENRFKNATTTFESLIGGIGDGELISDFQERAKGVGGAFIDVMPSARQGDARIALLQYIQATIDSLNEVEVAENKLSEKRSGFLDKYLQGLRQIEIKQEEGIITPLEAAKERANLLEQAVVLMIADFDDLGLTATKEFTQFNKVLERSNSLISNIDESIRKAKEGLEEDRFIRDAVNAPRGKGDSDTIFPNPEEFSQADQLGMQWAKTLSIINRKVTDGAIIQSEADNQRLAALQTYVNALYEAGEAVPEWMLTDLSEMGGGLLDEDRVGNIAAAWERVSNALNQVANNIPDGSGLQSTIKTMVTLAGAIAAAASVAAALKVLLGDASAPSQAIGAAAAVFTGLAGVIGAVASLGGGGGSSVSGYNGNLQDRAELYTTIRGSDLQLVLSRNGQMSGRRG